MRLLLHLFFYSYLFDLHAYDQLLLKRYRRIDYEVENFLLQNNLTYVPQDQPLHQIVAIGDHLTSLIARWHYFTNGIISLEDRSSGLSCNGCFDLGVLLSPNQINEIRTYLQNLPLYYGHTIRNSPSNTLPARNLSEFKGVVGCYSLHEIAACPYLMELASNPKILNIAASYLGCLPTIYDFNILWTTGSYNIHSFHRDYDDFRQVTLFVYLTDVFENADGPHVYMMKTHRGESQGQEHTFFGPSGKAFLTDPLGLHKGTAPQIGKARLLFWARYGLSKNYVFRQNNSFKDLESVYGITSQKLLKNINLKDPGQLFLWRLFLKE